MQFHGFDDVVIGQEGYRKKERKAGKFENILKTKWHD